MSDRDLRPLRWMGSSLEDLRQFPSQVKHAAGYALYLAQKGEKAVSAKPLKGVARGAGVLEVVEDFQGDTFRAVCAVPPSRLRAPRVSEEVQARGEDASP